MLAGMNSLVVEGSLIYANLLLQLTVFSLVALVLASRFKNNAVVRYSILYTSLLSLTLLCVISLTIQSRSSSFLLIQLESPVGYLDYLLPQLDSLFLADSQLVGDSSSAIGALDSASVPSVAFFGSMLLSITSLPLYLFIQMLWLGGFLVSTVGLLRSLHNADRIVGRSQKLKADERRLLNSIVNQNGIADENFQCRESAEIDSPVLVGIVKPVLLVPVHFFERFSEDDIRAVLRHEMAHVTRRDSLFNFLQKIILNLFWFHPFIHSMDRMIVRAREEICDNYVLAEERAADYGEVLFRLNLSQPLHAAQSSRASHANISLGVISRNWNLEHRISDLLNQKREKLMRLSQRSRMLLNVSIVATAFAVSACQVTAQDGTSQLSGVDGAGQQEASATTVEYKLSPLVMSRIAEIQALMAPETNAEPDWEAAKGALDRLYEERFERMNDFEKSTLLNFYTNYYLSQENYAEATAIFEKMLEIEQLRPDIRLRVLRSLGQLHAALESWSDSIGYYEDWQAESASEDHLVYRGLSYAHYQLEQFEEALPIWLSYMALRSGNDDELPREDYSYLIGLHYTLENWEQALEVTKETILLFNTPKDWENLRAIFRELDEAEKSGAV